MQNNFIETTLSSKMSWCSDIILIFVVGCVIYMALGFMRPLASPDEGRYSEIPREMVAHGDYVTPRLNDMPYFYKPPFFYWMQAASIKTFGINRFSLRFPNALMAVFGICATYAAARALSGRAAGVFSAGILATSILYLALGQIITLDTTVSVFISSALFAFIVGIKKSGLWRHALIAAFFVLCALAVLTKGLIGIVIPAAIIFLYAICTGPVDFFKKFGRGDWIWILIGIALFAIISVPWHILASLDNPAYDNAGGIFSKEWEGQGFFWYYIIHEHFLRYIDVDTSMREQPWWFFIVLSLVGFIPWVLLLPRALKDTFGDCGRRMLNAPKEAVFFCIWIVFVVFFFSLSKSKLAPYILPIFPALSVLTGAWFAKCWKDKFARSIKIEQILFVVLGYLVSVAPIPIYFVLSSKGKIYDHSYALFVCISLSVIMLILTTATLYIMLVKKNVKAFMAMVFVVSCVFSMYFNPMAILFQRSDTEPLAKYLKANRKTGEDVAILRDYNHFHDLPVWLGETVYLFDVPPLEQRFGFMREKQKHAHRFFPTAEQQSEFIKSRKAALWVLCRTSDAEILKKLSPAAEEIMRNGDILLFRIERK